MQRFSIVLLIACLPVVGCVSDAPPPPDEVGFIDSRTFDERIHDSLDFGHPAVTVTFSGIDATINAIPERIDKWVFAVDQSGGSVAAEPDPRMERPRSAVGIGLTLALGAYAMLSDHLLYRPAGGFDAVVYFAPESGRLTRLVFVQRVVEEEG